MEFLREQGGRDEVGIVMTSQQVGCRVFWAIKREHRGVINHTTKMGEVL